MVEFEQLEDSQKRAALVHDRNYHLTAGAGSGKTTTFAARYVKLLQQTETDPESIAAITFTETGAMELQERVRKQVTDRLDDLDQEAYDEWRDHLDTLPEARTFTRFMASVRVSFVNMHWKQMSQLGSILLKRPRPQFRNVAL